MTPTDDQLHGPSAGSQDRRRKGWLRRVLNGASRNGEVSPAYRSLALQLQNDLGGADAAEGGAGGRCIMLATPDSQRAAAEACTELAYTFASDLDSRVLVIDGCLNGSGITQTCSSVDAPGLLDLLRDGVERFADYVRPTAVREVHLLPVGRRESHGRMVLRADLMGKILDVAKAEYGFVLVPCGAMMVDSTPLVFPPLVDCVLLVAMEGKTLLKDLETSRHTLLHCRARKLALVLARPARRW